MVESDVIHGWNGWNAHARKYIYQNNQVADFKIQGRKSEYPTVIWDEKESD